LPIKKTLVTSRFFAPKSGPLFPFPKGLKDSISQTKDSSIFSIAIGESIFITGIISSSVNSLPAKSYLNPSGN